MIFDLKTKTKYEKAKLTRSVLYYSGPAIVTDNFANRSPDKFLYANFILDYRRRTANARASAVLLLLVGDVIMSVTFLWKYLSSRRTRSLAKNRYRIIYQINCT